MRIVPLRNVPVLFGATWVPYTGSVAAAIAAATRPAPVHGATPDPYPAPHAPGAAHVYAPKSKSAEPFWKREVGSAAAHARATSASVTAGVVAPAPTATFTAAERKRIGKATLAAAALATRGTDGVYVLDLKPDQWWFCGVRGNQVIAGTDAYGPPESILPDVRQLAKLGLPVLAPAALTGDRRLAGSRAVDVARIIAVSDPALRAHPYHPATKPLAAVIAVAVLVVIAGFGVHAHRQHTVAVAVRQNVHNQLHTYALSVQRAVGTYPRSAAWVLAAMDAMRNTLPPVLGGFALDTVTCTPAACSATYRVATHYGYITAPFHAAFPDARIALGRDGHSLALTLPLHAPTTTITLPWLRAQPRVSASLTDWIGTLPAMAPGAHVSGQPLRRKLTPPPVPGASLPTIEVQQTKVESTLHLAPGAAWSFVTRASYGGFLPTSLTWAPMGFGWNMLWERVHAS